MREILCGYAEKLAMLDAARLLGFAFANADLLFEIERDLKISFATGAVSGFSNSGELAGTPAGKLFDPSDGVKFATFAKALGRGGRAGPIRLKLADSSPAFVSLCHLPQNGTRISCTLSKPGSRESYASPGKDAQTGLSDRDSFLAAAREMASGKDALALVNVPGLEDVCAKLPQSDANKLLSRIGNAVAAGNAKAAARLDATHFGAIGGEQSGAGGLASRILAALEEGGAGALPIEETLMSLQGKELSADQRMLAVRYVVDGFVSGEHKTMPADAGEAFDRLLGETEKRALAFTKDVAEGAFELSFQPIYSLASGALTHCEALARFGGNQDTGKAIKFAEAMNMAGAFDLAATARVLAVLDRDGECSPIAVNLSGHTLITPAAFGMVAGLLAHKRKFRNRLMIEITETAEISELEVANSAIQVLRDMGFRVGLDDFGAGAASLQYLNALAVDYVKFDGSLIKKIGESTRGDTLLSGTLNLCKDLGVETIAECIETADIKKRCADMGFDMGQGYLLGKPGKKPPVPAQRAKRKGVLEFWG